MDVQNELTDYGFTTDAANVDKPIFYPQRKRKKKCIEFVGTGEYRPDRWRVQHPDGTHTDDVNADFITQEFGAEFKNYVENTPCLKFTPRPQFVYKFSHLNEWPKLIDVNAPKV